MSENFLQSYEKLVQNSPKKVGLNQSFNLGLTNNRPKSPIVKNDLTIIVARRGRSVK